MSICTHILIPTDGSELAAKAEREGMRLAKEQGARITWFTALPEYELPTQAQLMNRQGTALEEHDEIQRSRAHELLDPLVRQAREAGLAAAMDYVLDNHPAEAIARAAQRHGCDLIVMASHARTGFSALIHGSETREVLAKSGVPTLVYR